MAANGFIPTGTPEEMFGPIETARAEGYRFHRAVGGLRLSAGMRTSHVSNGDCTSKIGAA